VSRRLEVWNTTAICNNLTRLAVGRIFESLGNYLRLCT
jgi:hypothetical protein